MHVILWQFTIAEEHRSAFVAAYGPEGDWAALFRRAAGYRGTTLLQETGDALHFVTLDHWDTAADFQQFQERFGEEYLALDARLEGLTLAETKIGTFETPGEPSRDH